jgi:hypothetical protein
MLLLLGVALFIPNVNATTANQQQSENFTTTTNSMELISDNQSTETIQDTTTSSPQAEDEVNVTEGNSSQTNNSETYSTNSNTSSENSNTSQNIQSATAAAGDGNYSNVHAIWISADDVKNVTLNELKNAGITDVFVKSNRISAPTYPSVLNDIIGKLKDSGIRVHAWISCFVDSNGNWVDPQDKTYTNQLMTAITDITKNYNVDGIHLDYVRYPGTAYQHSGGTEAITAFVKQVYQTVKSIKPKVAVSAALMPEGDVNAYYYGQDYQQLSSYLDFLVPMIYKGNYNKDTAWIGSTVKYIVNHSNGKPVVAGLQTYRSDSNLTVIPTSEIYGDIKSAQDNGASGYALFKYGWLDPVLLTAGVSNTTVTFTIAEIGDAAGRVKTYVETNKQLPTYILIGPTQVNMAQFLSLLTNGLLQINSGTNTPITLKNYGTLTNLKENITTGNMYKTEYLKYAQDIKNYMDSTNLAPEYICYTSLGTYMRYESIIYMYSNIMYYYKANGTLPTYATVKPWTTTTTTNNTTDTLPSGMEQYLQATDNCQSTNSSIIALANSLTAGKTSAYDKATSIFNWVRDNIGYSFYYDTQYGAVGTLNSRTANCCDTSHLMVALARAAGLPARYVHGVCTFSSGTYGHVFAQIYVSETWYYADGTSSRNSFGVINNWNTSTWTLKGIYAELPF